jgi:hypothetical protein
MSLNRDLLNSVLEKTAFAPPMADPMAAGGAPPMDPAMMGGAPPMDPAMMGGAPPMDPAMMGGAPPMDPAMAEQLMAAAGGGAPMDPAMGAPAPGPAPEQVGALAEDPAASEPKVSDMTITDLQTMIADTVAAALSEGNAPVEGQVSEIQDAIAAMKESEGAIPTDSPEMPAPMMEGFDQEVEELPEMPKVASETSADEGLLLQTLNRLNTLR